MPRKKANKRLALIRNLIIGFVGVLVIGILGYGLLYSNQMPQAWTEGEHYTVLENAPPLRAGAPIIVAEYFSYACIHCRNLDPLIDEWRTTIPDDVRFRRLPVSFGGAWDVLAGGFYALEAKGALEQNHNRLFRAIHDQGRSFISAEMLADFVDGNGVNREDFLQAFASAPVRREVTRAKRLTRELGVTSVPTFIVGGRYRVSVGAVGRVEALALTDFLLDRIRQGETGVAAAEPAG